MPHIQTDSELEATGELAELYRGLAYSDGTVDDAFKALSLKPALLAVDAEMHRTTMYGNSPLTRADREFVAVVVSRINGCGRCLRHHSRRFVDLHAGPSRERAEAVANGDSSRFVAREAAMHAFAEKLTRQPSSVAGTDIEALRCAGFDDRAILDLCNVVSYFNYANRMTFALG